MNISAAGAKHWSMKTALEQIDVCSFECGAGPLQQNQAYLWLKRAAEVGPEFWPGQGVYFEVQAEAAGKTLTQWIHFYIVGCHMVSDAKERYWTYSLSYDPPAPCHIGTVHFHGVSAERLRLDIPSQGGVRTPHEQ